MIVRTRGLGASPTLVTSISDAITRMENTNPSYNNPGGLIAGPGAIGTAPNGIAIFPDAATGRAALERQVGLDIDRGWTLNQLINSWAPVCPDPICKGNNPTAYSNNVSSWTGLPQDVPLDSYSASVDTSGDVLDMVEASDGSGWWWAAALGGAILLAVAFE